MRNEIVECAPQSRAILPFAQLAEKRIRRGVFTSVPQLEKCLRDYLGTYNADPRPLVWTKSVAEILEKVDRGRAALANAV